MPRLCTGPVCLGYFPPPPRPPWRGQRPAPRYPLDVAPPDGSYLMNTPLNATHSHVLVQWGLPITYRMAMPLLPRFPRIYGHLWGLLDTVSRGCWSRLPVAVTFARVFADRSKSTGLSTGFSLGFSWFECMGRDVSLLSFFCSGGFLFMVFLFMRLCPLLLVWYYGGGMYISYGAYSRAICVVVYDIGEAAPVS